MRNQLISRTEPNRKIVGMVRPNQSLFIKKKIKEMPIKQDYLVNCKVIEAKLSKDLSSFFSSSINVLCEIKFNNTQVEFSSTESKIKSAEIQNLVTSKYTSTSIG